MDTTIAISSYDKCVNVLKYLFKKRSKMKTLALVYVNILQDNLCSSGVCVHHMTCYRKLCIENEFFEASNMSGNVGKFPIQSPIHNTNAFSYFKCSSVMVQVRMC